MRWRRCQAPACRGACSLAGVETVASGGVAIGLGLRRPPHPNRSEQDGSTRTARADGDDEGILLLTRMPNADEAATLCGYVSLRQTRNVGAEHDHWKRSAQSWPPLMMRRTRLLSRTSRMRQPSCLISWSQSGPVGTVMPLTGMANSIRGAA